MIDAIPGIGRVIRSARTSEGLSQQAVADFIGVSHSYISLIETGKRTPPPALLCRIAVALGVEPSLLHDGDMS